MWYGGRPQHSTESSIQEMDNKMEAIDERAVAGGATLPPRNNFQKHFSESMCAARFFDVSLLQMYLDICVRL